MAGLLLDPKVLPRKYSVQRNLHRGVRELVMAVLTKSFIPVACSAVVVFGIAAANLTAQERHAPAPSPPAARPTAQPRSQPASPPRTSTERSSAPRRESSEGSRSTAGSNADQQPGRHRPEGTPTSGQASGRDRGDHPAVGTAVPRRFGPRPIRPVPPNYYYYYPYWYGGGLGYYYDPYWWGGYPSYGYGYPYGYGSTYGYGYGYGYPSYQSGYGEGGIRLKVKPRDAQVFVDGYFAGVVDSFDGAFQKLTLPGGAHHIELRAPGYETLTVDVRIYSDETITYRGELHPVLR